MFAFHTELYEQSLIPPVEVFHVYITALLDLRRSPSASPDDKTERKAEKFMCFEFGFK